MKHKRNKRKQEDKQLEHLKSMLTKEGLSKTSVDEILTYMKDVINRECNKVEDVKNRNTNNTCIDGSITLDRDQVKRDVYINEYDEVVICKGSKTEIDILTEDEKVAALLNTML